MNASIELERSEIAGLEWVAEGRVSTVPEDVASRLLAKGLVQKANTSVCQGPALELTPAGLSLIRSSDQ